MSAPRITTHPCGNLLSGDKALAIHVTYGNGQFTRYIAPEWWYRLVLAGATVEGKGVGYIVARLKAAASVLKPQTVRRGSMAAERHAEALRDYPGESQGFAATLEMMQ